MNANDFGKKLGIGVRVAGRVAQQHAQHRAEQKAQNPPSASNPTRTVPQAREVVANSRTLTRAAGRGIGGFLRPFGRVGGLLWLEVTGFFFGLFTLYFAQDVWRTRLSYAAGPQHTRFLIAVGLTLVFGYLSLSAFWRARRR